MRGGLVLLKSLILEKNHEKMWINLDERASALVKDCKGIEYYYIRHSILGRLKAELRLSSRVFG